MAQKRPDGPPFTANLVEVLVRRARVGDAVFLAFPGRDQLIEDVEIALALALAHNAGFFEQVRRDDTAGWLAVEVKLNVHVLQRRG